MSEFKVFVGNVPYMCSKNEFVECFENVNGYVTADVVRKNDSAVTRGFGFVILDSKENMDKLLSMNLKLKDRVLRLATYSSENVNVKPFTYKVFLRNIPKSSSSDEVMNVFSKYGNVESCNLNNRVDDSVDHMTAVVEFSSRQGLLNSLNEKEVNVGGNVVRIYPFRKKNRVLKPVSFNRNNDPNAAYRGGFESGKIIGYKEGYEVGYKAGLVATKNNVEVESV